MPISEVDKWLDFLPQLAVCGLFAVNYGTWHKLSQCWHDILASYYRQFSCQKQVVFQKQSSNYFSLFRIKAML